MARPAQTVSDESDQAFREQVARARDFLHQGAYDEALKAFKKASKGQQGSHAAECYLGMAQAQNGLKHFGDALKSSDKALGFAEDDRSRSYIHYYKGVILLHQGESKKQKFEEAEAEFRTALKLNPDYAMAQFRLGLTLLKESRDPEGIKELEAFLPVAGNPELATYARRLIREPRAARENLAPDFSFTSLQGQEISLGGLSGKVLLVDFWATWCGPCREALPTLKEIYKKYSKDPRFVLISISVDENENAWRQFVAKQDMDWPQFLDRSRELQGLFSVNAYPTYFVIDSKGVILAREEGEDMEINEFIGDQVRKALSADKGP
jgi:thiol-disulfide isomerase/thioredoxin